MPGARLSVTWIVAVFDRVTAGSCGPSPPVSALSSMYWTGNETVAVCPWPAVAVDPSRTPKSLTVLMRLLPLTTVAGGESKQNRSGLGLGAGQLTGAAGLAAPRLPTTAR